MQQFLFIEKKNFENRYQVVVKFQIKHPRQNSDFKTDGYVGRFPALLKFPRNFFTTHDMRILHKNLDHNKFINL